MQQSQVLQQMQEGQPHLSEGGLYSYGQPPLGGGGSNYYPDQPQMMSRQPVRLVYWIGGTALMVSIR